MANSAAPDQLPHSVALDLSLFSHITKTSLLFLCSVTDSNI